MLSCSVVVAWLSGVSAVVYGPRREPPKFRSLRSITELAAAEGYEATNIELLTEDGYSLWIHRIGNNSGPPVLFQHGILLAADSWITRPHKDLAFVLLERGYDVWLSNQRGTVYNEYSLRIPKTNPKYWDFSFHEAGYYDLPASIDAVLDKRGVDKLFYIAHSLGTTTFLVMTSCRPEYNTKIKAALLLAPIAYGPTYSEMKPFLRKMVQAAPITYKALQLLGHYQIGYRTELKIQALKLFCGEFSVTQSMCLDVIGLYTGEDRTNLDKNDFHNFIPYGSAGTSIKTLYHLAQNFRSGEFRQFDYGAEGNLQRYQNTSPPSYRLNLVTPPVALIWGLNDNFLSETSVKKLASHLPNVIYNKAVADPKFAHFDMILGADAREVLHPSVVEIMESFTKEDINK
ncbi:unnamed protein product [Nezara viridula]|uniref:Lipase n=1 Tax=Nezara viridula TaxID=85310 RepID=A0A9P0HJH9_NEZVI|nr:unnamed protein product [Nezara viridula]